MYPWVTIPIYGSRGARVPSDPPATRHPEPAVSMEATPARSRLCSLCQQCYGSGLRDHVAASDILRSRRMLLDRSSIADPRVRQGIDEFLDDLTRQRTSTDLKHQQLMSVCAFCIQFLPPMYQEDKLVDDLRHHLLATGSTHAHPTGASRHKASNLVIQHHLPKRAASSGHAPRSPQRQLTYRLLTDEITRVLQLDASTMQTSLSGQSNLMAGDAIKNLRHQERRQSAQMLAARRAKQAAVMDALQKNFHIRGEDESLSSDIHRPRTEKKNFVRAASSATTGASSLYTGVMIQHPPAHRSEEFAASKAAQAQVVRSKTGRYFKTELKFPRLNK